MGKIGPEGISSPDSRSSRSRLYPIGRGVISQALPILQNPEKRAAFTRKENATLEAENPGLARYVKRAFAEYRAGEEGVGENSFYGFYDGVLVTLGLMRLQAADQIPVLLKKDKRDDVEVALKDERERRISFAVRYKVPPSAFEQIAYRRIVELTSTGNPEEAHLSNLLLAQSEKHPQDGEAFLVGAAAVLFPMVDIWQKREEQREKAEAQVRSRRKLRFWLSKDGEDPEVLANAYTDYTHGLTEELAHDNPVWIR